MDSSIQLTTCSILGTNIAVTNMQQSVKQLTENRKAYIGQYICISNVHTTVMAYEDPGYQNIQNQAAMALPDGKPLSLVSRMRGYRQAARVAGPDLMQEILSLSVDRGDSHYFYGSTPETLVALRKQIEQQYPGIHIAGMFSPPFRPLSEEEDAEIVEQIRESGADYIWVGLGAPKQEKWMYEHKDCFNGIMLGVGAAFDFHAGTVKRAPRWMQEWCLEWLYRLSQDPKRLYKRYFFTNIKFMWLILTGR